MRIAHFAQFAPNSCGLYETTRDMIKSERLAGHVSELVDIGIGEKRNVGGVDERSGCKLVARDYGDVADFDLFVGNGNIPLSFLGQTWSPVVHILHGRPLSSFRLEQRDPGNTPVYKLHIGHAANPRVRKLITLWPEYLPYWAAVLPADKLASVPYAPCDLDYYKTSGARHEYAAEHRAKLNILVADMWREDTDPYEVVHGLIALARRRHDFKVHFLACKTPLGPWEYLFRALRQCGSLGECAGQMREMPERYRAADVVVTPHAIATRIVRESLACGCTLVGPHLSPYATFRCDPEVPDSVASATDAALSAVAVDRAMMRRKARDAALAFSLPDFAAEMIPLYEAAISPMPRGSAAAPARSPTLANV